MAVNDWYIGSEEGADFAERRLGHRPKVGEKVELDLSVDEKRALVAAGWISEKAPKKEGK